MGCGRFNERIISNKNLNQNKKVLAIPLREEIMNPNSLNLCFITSLVSIMWCDIYIKLVKLSVFYNYLFKHRNYKNVLITLHNDSRDFVCVNFVLCGQLSTIGAEILKFQWRAADYKLGHIKYLN